MKTQLIGIYEQVTLNNKKYRLAHVYFTGYEYATMSNYVIETKKGEQEMVCVSDLSNLKLHNELTTMQWLNWIE